MKLVRTVVYAVTLAAASSFLLAGVHPPNDNKLCSRCTHYRQMHDKNNGPCAYYLEDGCEGFLQ